MSELNVVNNPMEENEVHLFDDFVTEDSIYLIDSEDVEKKNEPTNFEGNNIKEHNKQCQVDCETPDTHLSIDCVELRDSSEGSGNTHSQVDKEIKEEEEEEHCMDVFYVKTEAAVEESYNEIEATDTHVDEDSSTSENDEKTKENLKSEVNNFRSKINDSDKLSNDSDSGDECEKTSCNIKEEESDFSEEDNKNSLHIKNEDEATFETKIEVEYHGVEHDDEDESGESLKGDKCTEEDSLTRHIKTKHKKINFTCPHCPKAYLTRVSLNHHIKGHHGDSTEREKYTCPYCDKIFSNVRTKNAHVRIHEGIKINCPHCPSTLATKSSLKAHIKQIHESAPKQKAQMHNCAQCADKFFKRDALIRHIDAKHGGFKYSCPHCPKAYSTRNILQQHVQSKHSQRKNNECSQCDKSFSTVYCLKSHVISAHEGVKLPCPQCRKMCSNVEYHLRFVHAVQKEYGCPLCDEKFSTRPSRLEHIKKTHDGYRYKCTYCPKSYKRKYQLMYHVRIEHDGSLQRYKFVCPHCPKAFTRSDYLKKHVKIKHGDPLQRITYDGPHCPKAFKSSEDLNRYVQSQHGDPSQKQNTK